MYYVLGSSEKKIIRLMSKSLKKSFASLIKFAFAVAFWIASKKDKSDKLMQMALVKRNLSPISHQQHGINLSGKVPLG